jgi:hypothetical protein
MDVTEPRPAGSAHGPAGPPKVMKTPNCRSWLEAPAPHWFFVGQALPPANQFLSHLDRVFNAAIPRVALVLRSG